jgi:nucleoside-diphosphate-sugar epimerase
VEDCADAILAVLRLGVLGRVYNVGTANEFSINEVGGARRNIYHDQNRDGD